MSSTAWDYFEGVPRVSLDFGGHSGAQGKGSPPQVLRRGRSGPKGPLTENSGREESAGFARIPPHAEVHLARERNSLERSKRGVGPFRGLLVSSKAFFSSLLPTGRVSDICVKAPLTGRV